MANWARSLSEGLQTGIQLGSALRDANMRSALRDESAKYGVTEGAYGPELQANIDQVRALQTQNPDQAAQYEPAIAELTRRQGLTAPDYSVASGPANFATRQEARQAAAPMRTEGLAGVYRQYGDVVKADELEGRAQQQRMTALQIGEAERLKAERDAEDVRKAGNAAEWKKLLTVKDADGNETQRPIKPEDYLTMAQKNAASYFAKGDAERGGQAYDTFMDRAQKQIVAQEGERNRAKELAFAAVKSGDPNAISMLDDFYNKYLPNGSIGKSTLNPDGTVTTKHTDLMGNPLPDTKIPLKDVLQGLAAFGDSKQALAYVHQSFTENIQTQTLQLQKDSQKETKRHNEVSEGLQRSQLNQPKMGNMIDVVAPNGALTQIDRSKYIDKNGALQLPQGYRLFKEDTSDKTLRINDQGVAMQGSKIVGRFDQGTNSIVPNTPNPLTSNPKENQQFIEAGVQAAPVQTARGGAYKWGFTTNGQDYYDTPQEALVEKAQRTKPSVGLQSTVPAPTGPLPTLTVRPGYNTGLR